MGNMRFKVGDRVRIKSIDWYNTHCDDAGNVDCGCEIFEKDMKPYLGKVFTIHRIVDNSKYEMKEAFDFFLFTDEMIEGLAEEEISQNAKLVSERFSEYVNPSEVKYAQDTITKMLLQGANIPNEYILKDENGNVINATKIVLEKKKKEYPKTYEECCKVLGILNVDLCFNTDYRSFDATKEQWKKLGLMNQFYQLLICRDAYWKIAGEKMGLGKPWEPDWNNVSDKYCIYFVSGDAWLEKCRTRQCLFAFPTAEMRDAFYENFKELIETVKELLK